MAAPQDDILVTLMRGRRSGMSVAELRAETGWSPTALRDNLRVLALYRRPPWVTKGEGAVPARYTLTEKGREVARYRARRRR